MANHIIISGNICNDLEIKTSGETKILNFTVAVRRKFKDKNGEYQTDFIRCVSFNNQAEFIKKYFQKGSPILVEGSLQINNYETETGEKRSSCNIVIESIDFFGGKSQNGQSSLEQTVQQSGADLNIIESDDDLPF